MPTGGDGDDGHREINGEESSSNAPEVLSMTNDVDDIDDHHGDDHIGSITGVKASAVGDSTVVRQTTTPVVKGIEDATELIATDAPTAKMRRRRYRGGFTTSMNHLFRTPSRRSDCCNLACLGLLSSDRTRYLLTGERPSSLWRRLILYVLIPLAFVFVLDYFEYANLALYQDRFGNLTVVQERTAAEIAVLILFVAYGLVLYWWGTSRRVQVRSNLMARMYELEHSEAASAADDLARGETNNGTDEGAAGHEVDETQIRLYLNRHKFDVRSPHRLCSCYGYDYQYSATDDPAEEDYDSATGGGDMCTCLWKFFSGLFCGWFCGCWLQCCGMCALGQEERELDTFIPRQRQMIDYITFQTYSDYYPSIENLRIMKDNNILRHYRTLSKLSIKLLGALGVVTGALLVFALTNVNENFTYRNMIVLLLTLIQAFFVLFLVHWTQCRFDLSLDAVIKYYASGFLLTTPMAFVFEMIIGFVLSLFLQLTLYVILIIDSELEKQLEGNPDYGMKELAQDLPGFFLLSFFLKSFISAALVEEMVKYFGYWMLEHPDFLSPEELSCQTSLRLESNEGNVAEVADDAGVSNRRRNLNSQGKGVTVAMVSVALGFACCENLLYIFVYSPPTVETEAATLLMRSIFPVHPLCAAIQSIGVCRRDLEANKSYGVGRIVLPAILLHGFFDFALMAISFFQTLQTMQDEERNTDDTTLAEEALGLIVSACLVIFGVCYYVVASRSQKHRLDALDSAAVDASSFLI